MERKSKKNNSNNTIYEKDYRFVFLYFIGMLFVVMGHKGGDALNLMRNWFPYYSFHLALFMFCSGYFYKDQNEKNVKKYIFHKFKRLIITTFVWNICYGILICLLRYKNFSFGKDLSFESLFVLPLYNGHQFTLNMGSWYVISLFLVETFNMCFRKILGKYKNEWFLFIIYFLLGLVGIYMSNKGLNTEWWLILTRFLYFIPFYGLGIVYNRKVEKYDKVSNLLYFGIILTIMLFIMNYYKSTISIIPSWCVFPDNILLPYIIGTLGIAFWFRIAKIIEPIVNKNKFIEKIANHSYSIMMHQFLGFIIVGYILGKLSQLKLFNNSFDWIKFKSDIWYTFYPNNIKQWGIVYIISGLLIPIFIEKITHKLLNKIKDIFKKMCKSNQEKSLSN